MVCTIIVAGGACRRFGWWEGVERDDWHDRRIGLIRATGSHGNSAAKNRPEVRLFPVVAGGWGRLDPAGRRSGRAGLDSERPNLSPRRRQRAVSSDELRRFAFARAADVVARSRAA